MIDYALWEGIENGATLPRTQVVDGVMTVLPITNVEEKRNKADLDTMSMNDLYNNLKVYEPEVKGMSSSNLNTQNMAFLSSKNNSTNAVVNTAQTVNTATKVSTTSTQVNVAFSINIDNLSDAVIYAFLASQPNSPQLAHDDLEQIYPDDIEEMDLRWQMAMECRAPRNQDFKHKESTRRSVPVETPASIALVSCDGLGGYDWSDQADEGRNYALMDYTSSSSNLKVSTNSTCSKTCLKTVKTLKSQNKQLLKDFKKSELMVLAYKRSLKSVEEKRKYFKKNEFIYLEDIKVLKVEIQMKEIFIGKLRRKLKVAQKEKDGVQLKVYKFENASKSLDKLIECQIMDNCKKGLGYESYNAVPPPYTGNFMPPKLELSFTGLDECVKPEVENSHDKSSEKKTKLLGRILMPQLLKNGCQMTRKKM
nr:hypothetical protein [Tanacetum cinerariifolium]